MENEFLNKFIIAYKKDYKIALEEIKNGSKRSHWMWYIFPQIQGLGQSETSIYYSIKNINEAKAFLENDYLKENLIKICEELLKLDDTIINIMGFPDNYKLCSSMTLFYIANSKIKIFKEILDKFYNGNLDERTIEILKGMEN